MVTVGIAHARTFETNAPMPRVNAQQASQNVGRRVLLVGRVLDGGVTVQTPDDGVVAVTLGKNSTGESGPMMIGKVVEICGVMDSQNSITEESRAYFGDSFGAFPSTTHTHDSTEYVSFFSPFSLFPRCSSLSLSLSLCGVSRRVVHNLNFEYTHLCVRWLVCTHTYSENLPSVHTRMSRSLLLIYAPTQI